MLNRKEITAVLITTLILGFTISLLKSWETFAYTSLAIFLIIIINILAKKIASYYLDSETEISLWNIKRYGFKINSYFKKPFPAGALFPIIATAFSFGYVAWMASLVFDIKPKTYRAAKRHGLYTFSEVSEYHLALIAAIGIFSNLLFAILGYILGFSEFSRLNIYYAFFNMIPLSDLDGNKIFFGSKLLWSFLAIITSIGIGYAWFLI
jgi:Zn-dependent protease